MSESGKPSKEARALMGRILSAVMDRAGLPAEEIAKRAGVRRQYIYKIRQGEENLTLDTIDAVCRACYTTLEDWIDKQSPFGHNRQIHQDVEYILKYGGGPAHALQTMIDGAMLVIAQQERERNATKRDRNGED